MNKTKLSALPLILSLLATPSFAHAEGELDGQWFNIKIKTTIKKYHSLKLQGADSLNDAAIKFDSGANCYSRLTWMGSGSQAYRLVAICQGRPSKCQVAI